jgi:hypothetical protein
MTPERVFSERFHLSPPPRLYHYTTQTAFTEIVNSKALWATDVRYLNDFEEYVYAVERAKSAIKQVSSTFSAPGASELGLAIRGALSLSGAKQFCVFSLSEDGDSLNQWRSYTRTGPGYALGFVSNALSILCEEHELLLGKCIYSQKEAEEAISQLASSYVADLFQYFPHFKKGEINEDLIWVRSTQFVSLFLRYASFIKNPAFKEEQEWRIVVSTPNDFAGGTRFRSGPHSVVPFVALKWEDASFLRALKEVVIKPSPHAELAEAALKEFIKSQYQAAKMPDYDLKDFEVRRSEVPYREG